MLYKRLILLLSLHCLVFLPLNPVFAQEVEKEYDEEALFRFEEYVVSASKRLQRIEESPATITVVTAEDIRQSGLNGIPDILRVVAGLDLAPLTVFDTQIAIRGFSDLSVDINVLNKILVLINGRSVYEDFYGGTIWESLPIQLEDIERIEVVKGPGSVLYGANAFTGVINIITKSPGESRGGLASFTGGQFNHYVGSLIYDGKISEFGYRLSGGWERASQLEERDRDSEEVGRFFGIFNYKINESSKVSLEGGISDGKGEIVVSFPGALTDFQKAYAKTDYNYSDFKAQFSWRGTKFDMPLSALLGSSESVSLLEGDIRAKYNIYDLELQKSFSLAEIHTLMGGLNYRHYTISSNYTEQGELNAYAGFLQYEIKPIPSVIFNIGIRVDYQDYTKRKTNLSPRGSFIFTPLKGHTLCFSVGSAFRNPTYIDLYADVYSPILEQKVAEGAGDLDPESIISYEIGYRAALFERLKANLGIFYNKIEDLIIIFATDTFPVRSENTDDAEGVGGEVGLEYKITSWLNGLINYSYQWITDQDDNLIESNPRHKVNGGLRAVLKNGLSANILVHYVGVTEKEYAVPGIIRLGADLEKLDPYIIINARVSYKFLNDHFEVAMAGQNLLIDEYKEVGVGEEIPLRVFGNLSVRF
ncbi:MAG: TonB-dependent receptor [Deltaproteobacteria bacterium]|nr:MAG: TonB-dependent receptor [Deltaproteobacteria bacterium]